MTISHTVESTLEESIPAVPLVSRRVDGYWRDWITNIICKLATVGSSGAPLPPPGLADQVQIVYLTIIVL